MFCMFSSKSVKNKRSYNEDSCTSFTLDFGKGKDSSSVTFLGVCDGIGGGVDGELYARNTLQIAGATIVRDLIEFHQEMPIPSNSISLRDLVSNAIEETKAVILEMMREKVLGNGGTTVVFGLVSDDTCYYTWLGDSRLYIIRKTPEPSIERLTKDMTVAQELVDQEKIKEEDYNSHPKSHTLTRYIGSTSIRDSKAPVQSVSLSQAELLLLTSDGIHGSLSDEDILKIAQEHLKGETSYDSLTKIADSLITNAEEQGSHDNQTVLVYCHQH